MSHYTKQDILDMVEEEDVEFIRLQFTDLFGTLKNVAITKSQLERALDNQYVFDGSSIEGFARVEESDMFLHPDLDTFCIFPWRPQQGKVARIICDVYDISGKPYAADPRGKLKSVLAQAKEMGYTFQVGPECEFFLLETDDEGLPTLNINERAGYFDLGPNDLGENARRDIVLTMEDLGVEIEASHHEIAAGQHEVDLKYGEALSIADAFMTFKLAVKTVQGNNEQSKGTELAQQTMVNATDAALNATLTAKQKNNDETLKSDAARTEGEVTFSIAGAMAKCFEFLGPIAGPIAAAVVMSTLMGLLQWALSSALGGGKKKNSSKGPNTKVVSGMLTYDSGNVQDLRPFVGDDGSLYWATEDNKPHNGVSLITHPTATTINGQRALVAENGPELVIGRETTRAMMMNNPQLMKALVNYDRNYSGRRAYDAGNIAETSPTIAAGATATDEMTITQANTNVALLQAVETLLQRLEQPIEAKIDMYGHGKLYDSMTKANQFMKNK